MEIDKSVGERKPVTIGHKDFGSTQTNGSVGELAKQYSQALATGYFHQNLSVEEKRTKLAKMLMKPKGRVDTCFLGDVASRLGEDLDKIRRLVREGKYTL